MARHLAPFSWRQRMAEMVRRRSFGCVLPLGRHASTNGSKFVHCASDTIALSSFQKEQNARHHKQFKREQALVSGLYRLIYRLARPFLKRLAPVGIGPRWLAQSSRRGDQSGEGVGFAMGRLSGPQFR